MGFLLKHCACNQLLVNGLNHFLYFQGKLGKYSLKRIHRSTNQPLIAAQSVRTMSTKSEQSSEIKQFFAGKNILITGVTGVCGRIFFEKVLRALTTIGTIYVLIRGKRNLTAQERLKKLLSSLVFRFHTYSENQFKKIVLIDGDVTECGLGISESDRNLLVENVNIVFHIAASVKFNVSFSTNFKANVIGTENVMLLLKTMKSLQCFVHVSTAYCNCQHEVIQETLEPLIEDASLLLDKFKNLSEDQLNIEALKYFDGRPNNYVFTKAISEHVVNMYRGDIPTVIARPAIVAPAYEEPKPGYVDNLEGPLALSIVFGLGILQIIDWDFSYHVEFTPVDTLANSLCALACRAVEQRPREMKIYNICVSSLSDLPENYDLLKTGLKLYLEKPSILVIRPPFTPPRKPNLHPLEYRIKRFFYHTILAYIIDFILLICGQKRIMVRSVDKMHKSLDVLKFFANNEWHFQSDNFKELIDSLNEVDKKEFHIDVREMDIFRHLKLGILFGRRYILKESDKTIPIAIIKYKLQSFLYSLYQLFLLYLVFKIIWMFAVLVLPSQTIDATNDVYNSILSSLKNTFQRNSDPTLVRI